MAGSCLLCTQIAQVEVGLWQQLLYMFNMNDAYISLCICRCILHALAVLHQAGFAHTDLRWENIILQHAGQWVLIDLEFACVLNSVPFTPEREPISWFFLYVNVPVRLHTIVAMTLKPFFSHAFARCSCVQKCT